MHREFTVKRAHIGDREYSAGETRRARPADVDHLVRSGCLEEKAAPIVRNKAMPKVKNKKAD